MKARDDQHPEHAVKNPDEVVTLGSTSSEVDAHLLADALRTAGIDARAVDAHAGGALPFSTLFPASVLVRAADYDDARGLVERIMPEGRRFDLPTRCPVCRYDMDGLGDDPTCPECGTQSSRLARIRRDFRMAPPPGSGKGVQMFGAVIGVIALGAIVAGFIAGVVYLAVWAAAP